MKTVLGLAVVVVAALLVVRGWQLVEPIQHVYLVLNGTISPSRGNLSVVGGEVLIYAMTACVAYLCLRFGYRLIDSGRA